MEKFVALSEAIRKEVDFSVNTSLQGFDQTQDAVDKVFSLFEIHYQKQFHSAFDSADMLVAAKKLWASSLTEFDAEVILKGARRVIAESQYLPVISRMMKACRAES